MTRVLSPVLIEIEGQKKKKIIHHDKLKIDEAEHLLLGNAGLDTLFDDNEVVASAAHQNNASVNNISPTLDGTVNDLIITSTPSPLAVLRLRLLDAVKNVSRVHGCAIT